MQDLGRLSASWALRLPCGQGTRGEVGEAAISPSTRWSASPTDSGVLCSSSLFRVIDK